MLQKNRLYPLVLVIIVIIVWNYRESQKKEAFTLTGSTMGTSYTVKYLGIEDPQLPLEIDSILQLFNQSLSTYIPISEISRFNEETVFAFDLPYFLPVLQESKKVYTITNGAFDPTVMPLVRAWGFGPENRQIPDSTIVDSLMQFVGFNKITFDETKVTKSLDGVELDFSAVAKGYGVDVLGKFLRERGIKNYFVEIGGEVLCQGKNDRGIPWRVGIEDPTKGMMDRETKAVIGLKDQAMATSGNYRNFYIVDGIKYTHTIDPVTGFPVQHTLLSATVFADRCITADAFATAFMVLGFERSKALLEENEDVEAFLIYNDSEGQLMTYSSSGVGDIKIFE